MLWENYVLGLIFMSILGFTPNYTVWLLMILYMFIIKCTDILDSIMIEDVLLVICDFGICWLSWPRG